MPAFIHLPCPCGRTLRVREDQPGTSIRCWGCGRDVVVPFLKVGGRLAGAFTRAVVGSLMPDLFFRAFGCAFVLSLLLLTPYAGRWLGLAFALVMAVLYQDLIRFAGESPRGVPVGLYALHEKGWMKRWLFAVLAVSALFAPLFFRNWGHLLPGQRPFPIERTLMMMSFVGWLIIPLILLAANAHDRAGRLSPNQTLLILVKHPWATLTALLVLPIGFCLVELLLTLFAWYENLLPLLVRDLFPSRAQFNRIEIDKNSLFYFDLYMVDRPMDLLIENGLPDHFRAMSRGFFLTGTIPESLTYGNKIRVDPLQFQWSGELYLLARFIFSVLSLSAAGTVLAVQAYWLGLITSIGSSRPGPLPSGSSPAAASFQIADPDTASVEIRPPMAEPISALGSVAFTPPIPVHSSPALFPSVQTVFKPPAPSFDLVDASTAPAESNGAGMNAFVGGRSTILIVDDERAFAHAIGKILAARGFAVFVAADGAEGLRQAQTCKPDLIILDLLLPDRPGMEICQALRAQESTKDLPIVVASYKSGTEDEVGALSQGADDFIGKPYAVEVLIARIEKQLERRRVRTV